MVHLALVNRRAESINGLSSKINIGSVSLREECQEELAIHSTLKESMAASQKQSSSRRQLRTSKQWLRTYLDNQRTLVKEHHQYPLSMLMVKHEKIPMSGMQPCVCVALIKNRNKLQTRTLEHASNKDQWTKCEVLQMLIECLELQLSELTFLARDRKVLLIIRTTEMSQTL